VTSSAADEAPEPADEARSAVKLAAILTLFLVGTGVLAMYVAAHLELWRASVFYGQFTMIEGPALVILAGFAITVLVMVSRTAATAQPLEPEIPWLADSTPRRIAITLGVLVITVVGTRVIFHDYLLYDDEYSGWFQAVIYSRGARTAHVPAEWCRWIASLTPTSISEKSPCTWSLSYLPVHSMIRGAFLALRADRLAEPVLAAAAVLLTFMTARRAWPDRPDRAVLAALFLAASTQFLVTAMTGFAMTSHLFFSMLWLWLYVRPERWALAVLPWVGTIALGLHSPFTHVLFVAPFIVRFLFQRRWGAFAYLAIVYCLGLLFWTQEFNPYGRATLAVAATPAVVGKVATKIAMNPRGDGISGAMSIALLATWSVPLVILCLLVAFLLWKRLDGFARWLGLSLLCTIGGRAIFFGVQGGGWGHRYAFGVLGNLALLAAIGAEFMAEALGRRRAYGLVAASLVAALAILLPLRGVQVERIVRPYARASHWLESHPVDIVVVPIQSVRWGHQLLRNDPFLRNTPKLVSLPGLKPGELDALLAAHPGRVRVVTRDELLAFGLNRISRVGRFEIQQ
jgi:hypothetical protein